MIKARPATLTEVTKCLHELDAKLTATTELLMDNIALGIELLAAGCPFEELWDGIKIDDWDAERQKRLDDSLWYLVRNHGWSRLRDIERRLPDRGSQALLLCLTDSPRWNEMRSLRLDPNGLPGNATPSASSAHPLRPLR